MAPAAPDTPTSAPASRGEGIFARDNLVAWCIVPFDGKQRSPQQRAEMLARIGVRHFAYDWRDQHLPTFNEEIQALGRHGVELTAVWFPSTLNADARRILSTLEKHKLTPQLWVSAGVPAGDDREKLVSAGADIIRPIAQAAAKIGCTVGIYNHGGWFGEPENQLAVIEKLGLENVGIVYNQHHGHDHVDRLEQILPRMLPRLLCLNLNGMTAGGDSAGKKILPVGEGELDKRLLKIIRDSGYRGRIGILNHTDEDAEGRLLDNLEGLEWLVPQLDGGPAKSPRPKMRTYESAAATRPEAVIERGYWTVESAAAREALPLYETTPAATAEELTPPNGWPGEDAYANWSRSHGNDANTRYSPLAQINRDNVASLEPAWTYHSRDGAANVQCNPVIVDGVLYGPTAGDHVVALNAATGEEIWRFKPFGGALRPPHRGRPALRGLTHHAADGVPPRLLFAEGDALWAVHPKTGKPIESFGQGGRITITDCVTAPAVFKNVLVYAGWNGDVFGVDVLSGEPLWTFHTVPRDGEPFADTWDKPGDGANCWGGMALDASRGIVYATTGSPKPNFVGADHRGDNLFANCVLAIDAATGRRLWHFQEIRHDIWDLDIAAPPVLVTINASRNGKVIPVDAVAAVTKIGNTLLLDRVSGKPLFPFRRTRAPTSKIPGERTAAYQPDVELPEPLGRRAFSLEEVTNLSPAARSSVLSQIHESGATFGWFRPADLGRPLLLFGLHGGAEWTGATFDRETGLLYVSTNEIPWAITVRAQATSVDETTLPPTPGRLVYEKHCMACHGANREGRLVNPSIIAVSARATEADVLALLRTGRGSMPPASTLSADERRQLIEYLFDRDRPTGVAAPPPQRPAYRFDGYPRLLDKDNYPGTKPPWGLLNAIDLNTGKIAWRVPLGEHEELTARGIPKTGTENFGGPLVTAGGVVFCAGTRDLKIRAFDAKTGEALWSEKLPFGGFAPPATYEVNGKQYVVIAATGGGKLSVPPLPGRMPEPGDAYVAFALP